MSWLQKVKDKIRKTWNESKTLRIATYITGGLVVAGVTTLVIHATGFFNRKKDAPVSADGLNDNEITDELTNATDVTAPLSHHRTHQRSLLSAETSYNGAPEPMDTTLDHIWLQPGQAFNVSLTAYKDPNNTVVITDAFMADGSPLPGWVQTELRNPELVFETNLPGGNISRAAPVPADPDGRYVYVPGNIIKLYGTKASGSNTGNLLVIDTNTSTITSLVRLPTHRLTTINEYQIFAEGDAGAAVFDTTSPLEPSYVSGQTIITSTVHEGWLHPKSCSRKPHYGYTGLVNNPLTCLGFSRDYTPHWQITILNTTTQIHQNHEVPDPSQRLDQFGDYAVVTSATLGYTVMQINYTHILTPGPPITISTPGKNITDIAIDSTRNITFFLNHETEVLITDFTDPFTYSLINSVSTPGVKDFRYDEASQLLITDQGELFDTRNVTNIQKLGQIPSGHNQFTYEKLYHASGSNVKIYDTTNLGVGRLTGTPPDNTTNTYFKLRHVDGEGEITEKLIHFAVFQTPQVILGIANQTINIQEAIQLNLTQNFYAPDSTPLTFDVTAPPGLNASVVQQGSDQVLAISPVMGSPGNHTVTLKARNPNNDTSETLVFNVRVPYQTPVITQVFNNLSIGTQQQQHINLTDYFTAPDGTPLTYSVNANTAVNATVQENILIIEPIPGSSSNGNYTIDVTAQNPNGDTATQSFTVAVPFQTPVTTNTFTNVTIGVQQQKQFNLTNYFNAPDGTPLTYSVNANTAVNATVQENILIIEPIPGSSSNGNYTIDVTAQNPNGDTATQSFTVAVPFQTPAATNPLANITLGVETQQQFNLTDHFTAPDGTPLTYSVNADTAVNATVQNNLLILEPVPGSSSNGNYTIDVTAQNPNGDTATQSFTVAVPFQTPVTTNTFTNVTIGVQQQQQFNLTDYFTAPDGTPLTYSVNADTAVNATVQENILILEPIPGSSSNGNYTIDVTAQNPNGDTATQSFTVAVPFQTPVTTNTFTNVTIGVQQQQQFNLTDYFTAPDGTPLTYSVNADNAVNATLQDSILLLEPVPGSASNTNYTVQVTAHNPNNDEVTQSFTVAVPYQTPAATNPLANITLGVETQQQFNLTNYFNAPDGTPLTYSVNADTAVNATVQNNLLILKPVPGSSSNSNYTIEVTAQNSNGDITTQSFTVAVPYQTPTINQALADLTINVEQQQQINLTQYFTAPDGTELTYLVSADNALNASINGELLNLKPLLGSSNNTDYAVTITAQNPNSDQISQTFNIHVPFEPPVTTQSFNNLTIDTNQIQQLNLSNYFNAPDGSDLTYSVTASSAVNASIHQEILTLQPIPGSSSNTNYTVSVTATNENNESVSQQFTIEVPFQTPVTTNTFANVTVGVQQQQHINLTNYFTAPDGTPLTYAVNTDNALNASISNEILTLQPVIGSSSNNNYTVTVTATNEKNEAISQQFDVHVPYQTPSVISQISDQAMNITETRVIDLSAHTHSNDGTALTYTVISNQSFATTNASNLILHPTEINTIGSHNITVKVENNGGQLTTLAFELDATLPEINLISGLNTQFTTNLTESIDIDLNRYFEQFGNFSLNYSITSNNSFAQIIDGHILRLQPTELNELGRNNITITATNAAHKSTPLKLSLQVIPPVISPQITTSIQDFSIVMGTETNITIPISAFTSTSNSSLTYRIFETDHDGHVIGDSHIASLTGNNKINFKPQYLSDTGRHHLCVVAQDTYGQVSEPLCFSVYVDAPELFINAQNTLSLSSTPNTISLLDTQHVLTGDQNGLLLYPLNNLTHPTTVLSGQPITKIHPTDQFVFVANSNQLLQLNKTNWEIQNTAPLNASITFIGHSDNSLYASLTNGDVCLLEQSTLQLQSCISTGTSLVKTASEENVLYVATKTQGIWIYNTTNPTQPNLMSKITETLDVVDMQFHNETLFVVTRDALYVIDVNDLNNPSVTSINTIFSDAQNLFVEGEYIIALTRAGLIIQNIHDTSDTQIETLSNIQQLDLEGNTIARLSGDTLTFSDINSILTQAPQLNQPLTNIAIPYAQPFALDLSSVFTTAENSTFTITQINGNPLPNTLYFDAKTMTLNGTMTQDTELTFTATSPNKLSTSTSISLTTTQSDIYINTVAIPKISVAMGDSLSVPLPDSIISSGSTITSWKLVNTTADWVSFNETTKTLSVTPPTGSQGNHQASIIIENQSGAQTTLPIGFTVTSGLALSTPSKAYFIEDTVTPLNISVNSTGSIIRFSARILSLDAGTMEFENNNGWSYNATTQTVSYDGPNNETFNKTLRSLRYAPKENREASIVVETSVSDDINPSITQAFIVTGIPVDDAPTISLGPFNANLTLSDSLLNSDSPEWVIQLNNQIGFSDVDTNDQITWTAALLSDTNQRASLSWQFDATAKTIIINNLSQELVGTWRFRITGTDSASNSASADIDFTIYPKPIIPFNSFEYLAPTFGLGIIGVIAGFIHAKRKGTFKRCPRPSSVKTILKRRGRSLLAKPSDAPTEVVVIPGRETRADSTTTGSLLTESSTRKIIDETISATPRGPRPIDIFAESDTDESSETPGLTHSSDKTSTNNPQCASIDHKPLFDLPKPKPLALPPMGSLGDVVGVFRQPRRGSHTSGISSAGDSAAPSFHRDNSHTPSSEMHSAELGTGDSHSDSDHLPGQPSTDSDDTHSTTSEQIDRLADLPKPGALLQQSNNNSGIQNTPIRLRLSQLSTLLRKPAHDSHHQDDETQAPQPATKAPDLLGLLNTLRLGSSRSSSNTAVQQSPLRRLLPKMIQETEHGTDQKNQTP